MRFHRESARTAAARRAALVGVCLALALAQAREAQAYIDPGTGSYMLQAVIAGLLGAAFAVKSSWGAIKAWLSRVLDKPKGPPDAP